jgi:SAM-dependent methyltransferase
MLLEEAEATHSYCDETLRHLSDAKRDGLSTEVPSRSDVDPFVQDEIVRTCGSMYAGLKGRLERYPIPLLPFDEPSSGVFLDVGSNWGRWAFAASRRGFRSVGLDPSLKAVLAGQRVGRQIGASVSGIAGDARFLPFRKGVFDVVFSYSVLQHFDKTTARQSVAEMARVCKDEGLVVVQMPNRFGMRQIANQIRQRVRGDPNPFRIRYWSPTELRTTFSDLVGPTELQVDGFFSLNPQLSDIDLLPARYRGLVRASELLKEIAAHAPYMAAFADSLWVRSRRAVTSE